MSTHTVRIDGWHPAILNQWQGRHWSVGAKLKALDRENIAIEFLGTPKAEGKRRVSLSLVLGPKQRGGDPDAYWKSLLDALVNAGQLLDDSKEYVELGSVTYERGKRKATIITLEDV